MVYDEANRLSSAASVSGGTEYYGYTADNKRFYKCTASGAEQMTFYGARGEKLGVYALGNSLGILYCPGFDEYLVCREADYRVGRRLR